MLWDTSAISDLSAAPPVVPVLPVCHAGCQGCPISLSFDMGWEWQAGERGRPQAGRGALSTAAESCQDLASSSPKWRSSIVVLLRGWRLFQIHYVLFQTPWTEVAVCRDENHGRDFPFCAFSIQRHLSPTHPHIPWHCSKPPLCVHLHHVTRVCFSVVYFGHLLCSGKLPQCYKTATLFLFSPISPDLPKLPFLKVQFEVSYNIPPYPAPILAYPVLPLRAKPSSSFLITSRMLTIANLSVLPRVMGLVYKPLCKKIKMKKSSLCWCSIRNIYYSLCRNPRQ